MFGCGVGRGDEVITPSLTYWATSMQCMNLGATMSSGMVMRCIVRRTHRSGSAWYGTGQSGLGSTVQTKRLSSKVHTRYLPL